MVKKKMRDCDFFPVIRPLYPLYNTNNALCDVVIPSQK